MRYRHVWPGFLLLGTLVASLIALLGWGDRILSPGPAGGLSRLLAARSAPGGTGEPTLAPMGHLGVRLVPPDAAALPAEPAERDALSSPLGAAPVRRLPIVDQPRYALDFGTFFGVDEAERAEAQLNQAGFSTVRFSRQDPGRVFSVSLPVPRDPDEGHALVDRLRADGFVGVQATAGDAIAIRIVAGVPLRTAVRIAGRLRDAGHDPRVAAEAPRTGQIGLRHGHFTSRQEAEAVKGELTRLGVAAEVVRIR
jgi:hypothetical protein